MADHSGFQSSRYLNEPPPPYCPRTPPPQQGNIPPAATYVPPTVSQYPSHGGLQGTISSVSREVGGVLRGITKAGIKVLNKALDHPTVDYLKNGNVVQLISRETGRSLQILQSADNRLLLDGNGGDGHQFFNAHFTVIQGGDNSILLHNNFNYLAVKDGIAQLYSAGAGGTATTNCRFKVRDVALQNQFVVFESAAERGRYISVLPTGEIKSAIATSSADRDTHFGVRVIFDMAVCRMDPCGIICIVLTYIAVLYADYAVVQWMVIPTMSSSLWGAFNVVSFNTIVFLLIMAHARAVFSDPGIVPLPDNNLDFSDMHSGIGSPVHKTSTSTQRWLLVQSIRRSIVLYVEHQMASFNHTKAGSCRRMIPQQIKDKNELLEDWTVCSRCETYRPPRAHHCRICQRCIKRMDHHCPWINNCVGECNQKYFIQFLIFVGVASIYAVLMVIVSWLTECKECNAEITFKQHRVIHSIILLIESLLFGIFVIAIMCDQLQAILTDETAIEQLQKKGPHRPRKPKMALLSEVCGRGSPALWIFPCQGAPRNIENLASYEV